MHSSRLKFDEFAVETQYLVDVDSPDHLQPCGTLQDNSTNVRFNEKLSQLYGERGVKIGLRILDLGCAGGGFIKSCLDEGCFAVGLEGSDYSRKYCRAHWPILDNKFLFTADITKPFSVRSVNNREAQPISFHVITMWEVLEHLREEELTQTFLNIKNHLDNRGILVVSVAIFEHAHNGVDLHQSVHPTSWWLERFNQEGFVRMPKLEEFFNGMYVRGSKILAPKNYVHGSTNYVFALNADAVPEPPRLSKRDKRLDRWYCTKMYRKILDYFRQL